MEQFFLTLGKKLRQAVPLREYANFKVGGPADYFFAASTIDEITQAIGLAEQFDIPFYILGGGYNLLFDDEGFRGLMIKNCVRGVTKTGETEIEAYSGMPIHELVRFCTENALEGFEFMAGIPGTVGGAVCGNAGAFERAIGSFLTEAQIMKKGIVRVSEDRAYFEFGYRRSRLRTSRDLLLKAKFLLEKGNRKGIESKIAENLARREKKHPPKGEACAGSYFKNPVLPDGKRVPAARLLDKVGAKGLRIGGAAVFSDHANFIINQHEATTQDILRLAQELKKRVKQEFGIELEEEVIYLPAEFSKL